MLKETTKPQTEKISKEGKKKKSNQSNHFFITLYVLCNMKLKTALLMRNNHLQKSKQLKKMIYIQTNNKAERTKQAEKNSKKKKKISSMGRILD